VRGPEGERGWGLLLLLLVSLAWAFSFGLIKRYLAGLDTSFIAAARMGLAALVFLPLLRPAGLGRGLRWGLAGIGAVQYGLMYTLYIAAFAHLRAWEVALFTLFTPLYVTLLEDLAARRFHLRHQAAALMAVGGAALIEFREPFLESALSGFLLVQGANFCFAFGQVAYRRLMGRAGAVGEHRIFGLLFLGALAVTVPPAVLGGLAEPPALDLRQAGVLLYLGLFAAGLCFFLWNYGARRVEAGTLAVCNNLKVPLAVSVSILLFGETAALVRLLAGSALILAALLLARR